MEINEPRLVESTTLWQKTATPQQSLTCLSIVEA